MRETVAREIARFSSRVRRGQFVVAFAEALLVCSLALGALLLVTRLLGGWLPPGTWLAPAVLVPSLAYAAWIVRRDGFGSSASAGHLDRRLGLQGMLLTAMERDAPGWEERVREKLARSGRVRPRLAGRPLLLRAAGAAAIVAGLFLLPPPEVEASVSDTLTGAALEEFEERLERLAQEDLVREEVREELQNRIDDARRGLESGEPPSWSDLDAVGERLDRERDNRAAELARLRDALRSHAAEGKGGETGAAELGGLLRGAAESGLLDGLPEGLRSKVEQAAAGDSEAAAGLMKDAESRRQLAEAMAQAAGDKLRELAESGALDGSSLKDLEDLINEGMQSVPGAGPGEFGEDPGEEPGGGGQDGDGRPGEGGIGRGRADAWLRMTGNTEGGTDAFEAKRLPPGSRPSTEWIRLGVGRVAPETDPVRDGSAGSAGDAGSGEASWRRRLAPRHRRVVREFFSD